jgi:hypothetical protein
MRSINYKGLRGKSNIIKRNVEKVWGARYTLRAHFYRTIRYFILTAETYPENSVKFLII